MTDKIELIGHSTIQLGKNNNRIYVMKLSDKDYPGILGLINNMALNDGYTKIIAKIPTHLKSAFLKDGFEQEAFVRNYYNGKEDVYFLSKYFSKERQEFNDKNDVLAITQFCIEKGSISTPENLNNNFEIKTLDKEHIPQMIALYKSTFESYPFPIFDGNYLLKTMRTNIDYYGVFEGEKLIAISSSEMDSENSNTEMTDFATLQEYRGENLSYHLLKKMQNDAIQKGIKTAYTIARAKNIGMNMTFAKMAYEFSGTLINNTNICGSIETMNVWFKNLS